jgi:isochorismate hydrolase
VRATTVDAISYDLRVTIPHEAVFDRAVLSHKVSLMDIHMKYADVTGLDEVLGHLEGLKEGMFDDVYPPAAARARASGNLDGM